MTPYTYIVVLPDGRVCGVHRLLYHWTLHVDVHEDGYQDRYCYASEDSAISALLTWNGVGEPTGWHRHPKTGRRRNLGTGEQWMAA